uniref:Leucine rich repeat containing protein 23 n=1 Tax=Echinococcus canadensis TaxID=519352 RepID=A0A915EUK6_9CEST
MSTADLQTTTEIALSDKSGAEQIKEHPLSRNDLEYALYDIEETMDGLKIAAKTLICNSRSITDIDILQSFKNLQFINLSSNLISDISPLLNLTLVHELDCSSNKITWIPNFSWPFLTKLNLSNNKIKRIPRMAFPSLQIIYLNNNSIRSLVDEDGNGLIQEDNLPELHTLELRQNNIKTELPKLNHPLPEKQAADYQKFLQRIGLYHMGLKMLVLPENEIKTMALVYRPPENIDSDKGTILKVNPFGSRMGRLPNLVVLHLRGNGLRSLQGFTREAFASLKYLNLRDNRIANLEDLENLRELVSLEHLILTGNPVERMKKFRIELLILNIGLRRIDKEDYWAEDVEEAKSMMAKRNKLEEGGGKGKKLKNVLQSSK